MHRLLVVEDDNAVRNNIVTCLELEGFDVEAVGSTREALAKLQDGSYPIVLSDIYLDERTGLDRDLHGVVGLDALALTHPRVDRHADPVREHTGRARRRVAAVAAPQPADSRGRWGTRVTGFGWSFYGFFVAAVVWLGLYFVWAARQAKRDRDRDRGGR